MDVKIIHRNYSKHNSNRNKRSNWRESLKIISFFLLTKTFTYKSRLIFINCSIHFEFLFHNLFAANRLSVRRKISDGPRIIITCDFNFIIHGSFPQFCFRRRNSLTIPFCSQKEINSFDFYSSPLSDLKTLIFLFCFILNFPLNDLKFLKGLILRSQ